MSLRTTLGLLASFVLALGLGCSESSPGGDELMAPSDRDATPVSETGLERTAEERQEERLEEYNVEDPDSADEEE